MDEKTGVDSYKFLPRLIASYYQQMNLLPRGPIPWTPVARRLEKCRFGLVTSAGMYQKGIDPPFDLQRERDEPTWGDPTYRVIPQDIQQEAVGISHLHINPQYALEDLNVILPIEGFQALAEQGRIGGLADHGYSFMGYQGFPPNTTEWEEVYGPEVARRMKAEGVDCVLLTPF